MRENPGPRKRGVIPGSVEGRVDRRGETADVLATPAGPYLSPLLGLGSALLCTDQYSIQWAVAKAGTDGVGKESSSTLWHLGRGMEPEFFGLELIRDNGTCVGANG